MGTAAIDPLLAAGLWEWSHSQVAARRYCRRDGSCCTKRCRCFYKTVLQPLLSLWELIISMTYSVTSNKKSVKKHCCSSNNISSLFIFFFLQGHKIDIMKNITKQFVTLWLLMYRDIYIDDSPLQKTLKSRSILFALMCRSPWPLLAEPFIIEGGKCSSI